jgi:hypothetical protein
LKFQKIIEMLEKAVEEIAEIRASLKGEKHE